MIRRWKVTMELWRETLSGHDQLDNPAHIEIVSAASKKAAENKGRRQAVDPPKGRQWSHFIWACNVQAEPITAKEERELLKAMRGPRVKREPTFCVRKR